MSVEIGYLYGEKIDPTNLQTHEHIALINIEIRELRRVHEKIQSMMDFDRLCRDSLRDELSTLKMSLAVSWIALIGSYVALAWSVYG